MLHICFSFGLVKFETSLKVYGSFKLASSLTVRDATVTPQGAKDYGYMHDYCRELISPANSFIKSQEIY